MATRRRSPTPPEGRSPSPEPDLSPRDLHPGRRHQHGESDLPVYPRPRRRRRSLLLGEQRHLTVQGGPLEAGQSIDVPTTARSRLANDLTSAGTITMETSTPYATYLDLDGHTLTNTGTFDVNAGSEYADARQLRHLRQRRNASTSPGPFTSEAPPFTNDGVTMWRRRGSIEPGTFSPRRHRRHKLRPRRSG